MDILFFFLHHLEIGGLARGIDCLASAWPFIMVRRVRTIPSCLVRNIASGGREPQPCVCVGGNDRHIYPSRLRVLWRRRVRSWEFERGREQPGLPAVRGRPRRQEQPGPDLLRSLPAAPLPQGVSRLLSADQTAHLPAADQVWCRSIVLLNRNGHLGRMARRQPAADEF